jgi:phosphohistidine phosphatase SixA
MELYLMRHGIALSHEVDALRPLSPQGAQDVGCIGEMLRRSGVAPGVIWHSPRVRAAETAAILGKSLSSGLLEKPCIQPENAPNEIIREIAAHVRSPATQSLMIVSHLPLLPRLASVLTGSEEWVGSLFLFTEASVLCLVPAGYGEWSVKWFVTPEILCPRHRDSELVRT